MGSHVLRLGQEVAQPLEPLLCLCFLLSKFACLCLLLLRKVCIGWVERRLRDKAAGTAYGVLKS